MKFFCVFLSLAGLASANSAQDISHQTRAPSSCVVEPAGNSSIDDAPAIIDAFKQCGHNGKVVFLNETYHINTVMNTTGLKNCEVDLQGTLLVATPATPCATSVLISLQWGTNITYWLNNSLPVGYQNQVGLASPQNVAP
jgi:galacturan 1,4-alpha-galacturonidase